MKVLVSGGMDPLHIGHVRLINAAAKYGDVIAVVNSDPWLVRKKGYRFMPWQDRAEIVLSLKNVTEVSPVSDDDGTVCEALRRIRPDYLANGGDRTQGDPREHAVCEELGIEELFNIGGGKVRSSSELVEACHNHHAHAVPG